MRHNKNSKFSSVKYWACSSRGTPKYCKVSATMNIDRTFIIRGKHNHEPFFHRKSSK